MAIMNKTVTCAFCGKEMTNGFMKKESRALDVGVGVSVDCCPDCCTPEREAMTLMYHDVFSDKLDNCAWAHRKLVFKKEESVKMYLPFCEERFALDKKYIGIQPTQQGDFYRYDNQGHFTWREQKISFIASDKNKVLSVQLNQVGGSVFSKEDISCIRFCVSNRKELKPFVQNYTVEICVNDMHTVSGKPQFTRTEIIVKGMPFTAKKRATAAAQKLLEQFRQDIGSNLPVEAVKSFR